MDKSKGKEDDNVVIEEVAVNDFSDDSEDNQGFLPIQCSDDMIPIFEGKHPNKFGYKETL
eukprot:2736568-Ditylum_brightwellii.AAC.1